MCPLNYPGRDIQEHTVLLSTRFQDQEQEKNQLPCDMCPLNYPERNKQENTVILSTRLQDQEHEKSQLPCNMCPLNYPEKGQTGKYSNTLHKASRLGTSKV